MKRLLWAVFGNDDEPVAPDWYRPEWPRWRRQLYWLFFRNPLHNFTFYVIGIADKEFASSGTHPQHVFAPGGGWNRAVRRYKWLRLPFVSYQGEGFIEKFYIGWRERGNFGFKLNFNWK